MGGGRWEVDGGSSFAKASTDALRAVVDRSEDKGRKVEGGEGENAAALRAEARKLGHEALEIADRCEYRLQQADIHNALARMAQDAGDTSTARKHATTAHERAFCDGPPYAYQHALDTVDALLHELE